jgi:hypothetical protein
VAGAAAAAAAVEGADAARWKGQWPWAEVSGSQSVVVLAEESAAGEGPTGNERQRDATVSVASTGVEESASDINIETRMRAVAVQSL